MKHRLRFTEISKAAFCFFINYDRERLDVAPLTAREQEKIWQRAKRYAPAATDQNICLALTPSEVAVIQREGFKTKNRYITI